MLAVYVTVCVLHLSYTENPHVILLSLYLNLVTREG